MAKKGQTKQDWGKMAGMILPWALLLFAAQEAPPQKPETVVKVTTRIVQVSVVVHDKKGQPIADLKKEDFTLLDKGQEQRIRFFSMESAEAPPPKAPPLPEGVVSNRYANSKSGGTSHLMALPNSLTAILLDSLNTPFTDQHYAKEGVIKFLNQLQPGDRVAIYTLTGRLHVLHDFTSDVESLLRALARHKNQHSAQEAASSYEDANSGIDELDAFLDRSNENMANFYQAQRTQVTLKALQTIANHLAGMPGRKNLIWLSAGFPVYVGLRPGELPAPEFQSFSEEMQRTVRTLNDVGLAIYPVDARGLMGPFAYMPSMSAASTSRPGRGGPAPVDQRAQSNIFQTQSAMHEVADRTGGRAFMNTNDIAGAVRSAMEDTKITYVLAYSPSHDQWDGRFRDIKVKVNRSSTEIRYRKGYYAYPGENNDPKLSRAMMVNAINGPLVSTGLGILAKVIEQPSAEKRRFLVRVVMDAREVSFVEEGGQWKAAIEMLGVVRDDQGEPLSQFNRALRFHLTREQYAQMLQVGIIFNVELEGPPKSHRARLAVRDLATGILGSVDIPVVN